MIVLGDCNSMFDTMVRITAALKARLLGIEGCPIAVDSSIPAAITLNCGAETLAGKQSLLCLLLGKISLFIVFGTPRAHGL